MSMAQLIQGVRNQAAQQIAQRGVNRWGIVTSVDPSKPVIKVMLQPEEVLTGWIPIAQSSAGGGGTVVSIPVPGMMALLVPDLGDGGHYVAVGFSHSDVTPLPTAPSTVGTGGTANAAGVAWQAGESGIVGPGGSVVKMCADGSIYLRGNLNVDGNIVANGNVSDRHGSLDRLRGNYNSHTHTDPQGGSVGTTSAPDPE